MEQVGVSFLLSLFPISESRRNMIERVSIMAKLDEFDLEAISQGKAIKEMKLMVGHNRQSPKRPAKVAIATTFNKDRRALYR